MPNYRRIYVRGGTYFFTVTLLERRRRLLVDHIDDLRAAVRSVRAHRPFAIDAMVVLPDHLHCIWTLPADDADFSTRWRLIKTRFARAIPDRARSCARRARSGERGIWQRRFWEHLIRDERDLEVHFDYIHFNPVKHGHVTRVAEWPYSTFRRFVAAGVYSCDWAAGSDIHELDRE